MAAALICGFFSGLGIGGGSLLMVWMTAVLAIEQRTAQGINLLFYLPTAAIALAFHAKNGLVDWRSALPALVCGCALAAVSALVCVHLELSILRKLFGAFLLVLGLRELFYRRR